MLIGWSSDSVTLKGQHWCLYWPLVHVTTPSYLYINPSTIFSSLQQFPPCLPPTSTHQSVTRLAESSDSTHSISIWVLWGGKYSPNHTWMSLVSSSYAADLWLSSSGWLRACWTQNRKQLLLPQCPIHYIDATLNKVNGPACGDYLCLEALPVCHLLVQL